MLVIKLSTERGYIVLTLKENTSNEFYYHRTYIEG